jgi:hypothetical protein
LERFFNDWDIKGLEHYRGLCVRSRKNNFAINFIDSNFDPWENVTCYGAPNKINANYVINIKRHNPEYVITDAKQLMLYRFLINYDEMLYNDSIN